MVASLSHDWNCFWPALPWVPLSNDLAAIETLITAVTTSTADCAGSSSCSHPWAAEHPTGVTEALYPSHEVQMSSHDDSDNDTTFDLFQYSNNWMMFLMLRFCYTKRLEWKVYLIGTICIEHTWLTSLVRTCFCIFIFHNSSNFGPFLSCSANTSSKTFLF